MQWKPRDCVSAFDRLELTMLAAASIPGSIETPPEQIQLQRSHGADGLTRSLPIAPVQKGSRRRICDGVNCDSVVYGQTHLASSFNASTYNHALPS